MKFYKIYGFYRLYLDGKNTTWNKGGKILNGGRIAGIKGFIGVIGIYFV